MEYQLSLRYLGSAVESGEMDVYDTATNMIAFSDFVAVAAKTIYGNNAEVQSRVSGFSRGSFITDFVIKIWEPATLIISSTDSKTLFELVTQGLDFWKFLKGESPKSVTNIETTDRAQYLRVENNNGQVIQVHTDVVQLVFDEKAAASVAKFIREPLSKEGMEGMEIKSGRQLVARASREEGAYFLPVRPEDIVTDQTIKISLIIEAAVFKDDNKWRFHDGRNTIFADILDKEFLARVNNGELFGKGDVLRVELRIVQKQSGHKIIIEHTIIKVLEHRHGPKQESLV